MERTLLAHLPVGRAVHGRGGWGAAAADLGMSASAVSHAVRAVEEQLGQPLFARTTRSVRLTEAGVQFLGVLEPALADIAGAVDTARAAHGRVGGVLRLNAPRTALPMAVTPLLAEMTRCRYPDLTIEVTCDDGLADIVPRRLRRRHPPGAHGRAGHGGGAPDAAVRLDHGGHARLHRAPRRARIDRAARRPQLHRLPLRHLGRGLRPAPCATTRAAPALPSPRPSAAACA